MRVAPSAAHDFIENMYHVFSWIMFFTVELVSLLPAP